jgi:hypothetical protein
VGLYSTNLGNISADKLFFSRIVRRGGLEGWLDVAIFTYRKVKMGKHLLSHRYNFLPLLRSRPGGVQKELIVKDLPATNVAIELNLQKGKKHYFDV